MKQLLNEIELISLGGKLWEKGTNKRVYLNKTIIKELLEMDGYTLSVSDLKNIAKANTFFNVSTEELICDKGMVRVMFRTREVECNSKVEGF